MADSNKTLIALFAIPVLGAGIASSCHTDDDAAVDVATVPAVAAQDPQGPERTTTKPTTRRSSVDPAVVVSGPALDSADAFPPTLSDSDWHRDAWMRNDCLRCHETGVGDAPAVVHASQPDILLSAKCRTCHVFVPGSKPRERAPVDSPFEPNAFPPMIPASVSHTNAWARDDCLLCHETGVRGAPIVQHEGMPRILLVSKCRSCHVQVRAVEASEPAKPR